MSRAKVLGVSRSQLHAWILGRSKPRGSYAKASDAKLLPALRRLVDTRPTYGYRCIAALLHLAANLDDACRSAGWRAGVFRDIYWDITSHNQAGTGSEPEGRMNDAAEVIARILGMRQAE